MGLGSLLNPFGAAGSVVDPSSAAAAGVNRAVDDLVLKPQREEADRARSELERQASEAAGRLNQQETAVDAARRKKLDEERARRGRRASILTSSSGLADELGSVSRPQAQAATNLGGTFI